MSHGSFFWYDLISKDPAATRAFVTQLFGWVASEATMPDGTPYTSFSSGGNLICGLMPFSPARDFEDGRAHWMTYVQVDRLFATTTRVERKGGTILSDPLPVPELGTYQIIRDSEGALLALVEAQRPVLSHKFIWNSVIWNELNCRSAADAKDFYRGIAGWTATSVVDEGLTYDFFTQGGANVAGLLEMNGTGFEDVRPGWQTYLAVADVDDMATKAVECGGYLAASPFDLPGVGRIAIIVEPGGCQISLLHPPE